MRLTIPTPAATASTLGAVVQREYNVKHPAYGAKGDGTTDDTTAINNAIGAAQTAGGGIVFLPTGTYLISSALALTGNGIILAGAGRSATTIKRTALVRMVTLTGAVDCTIQDLTFDAQGATYHSGTCEQIYPDAASHNLTVQRCSFINSPGFALIVAGGPTSRVSNLRLLHNKVMLYSGATQSTSKDAIAIVSDGGCALGNQIGQNVGGTITGAAMNAGIYVYESNDYVCAGNTVYANSGALPSGPAIAIEVGSCTRCTVQGNTVSAPNTSYADVGIRVTVELDNGALARNCSAITVSGNAIQGTSTQTIALSVGTSTSYGQTISDIALSHNVADACYFGISFYAGSVSRVQAWGNDATTVGSSFYTFGVNPANSVLLDGQGGNVQVGAMGGNISFKGGSQGQTLYGLMTNGGTWEFGSGQQFQINATGQASIPQITMTDGGDVVLGSTTGTRIGTATGQKLGFYGATAVVKPTVTGSKSANAALASLVSALVSLGLIIDSSS